MMIKYNRIGRDANLFDFCMLSSHFLCQKFIVILKKRLRKEFTTFQN